MAPRGTPLCVDHLIFLDANVLFCAAYRRDAGLRRLWTPGQQSDLEELLGFVEIVPTTARTDHPLLSALELPAKDRPILLAAIGVGTTHLLTGGFRHFGPHYGKRIEGVLILSPGEYLSMRGG